MNRSTIKGIAYIAANIIAIIALFLPYYVFSAEGKESASVSLMPTAFGIILLLINIVSCGMVFAGLQKKCGFSAAVSMIGTIVVIIRMSMSKTALAMSALTSSGVFFSILSGSDLPEIKTTNGIGFYILLIGEIAVVITGILFALEDD